ncbi:MAG: hypothetical protein WBE38_14100, partial [Terracidiphilus sp.]
MNGSLALAAVFLCVCMDACYHDVRFYPVEGSAAPGASRSVLKGKYTGLMSGKMTVTLPDGERCSGAWKTVKTSPVPGTGLTTAQDIAAVGTDAGIVATDASRGQRMPVCQGGNAAHPQPPCDMASAWLSAWGRT